MQSSPLLLSLISYLLLISGHQVSGESPNCLAIYKEGGAPAVFRSPKCPRWILSGDEFRRSSPGCHLAVRQGRRPSQEDRAICALGLRMPFLNFAENSGTMRIKEIDVGIIAVFDGHNGDEASDLASKLFLEYFLLHVYFLLDGVYSVLLKRSNGELEYKEDDFLHQLQNYRYMDRERLNGALYSAIFDDSFHLEVLKESLVRSIHDIDSTFSKEGEALLMDLESGSTASVVIIADGNILSANLGDSKAFLCSQDYNYNPTNHHEERRKFVLERREKRRRNKRPSSSNSEIAYKYNEDGGIAYNDGAGELKYFVKELTVDHHPDREEERERIEKAGGSVVEWAGVVRVNGQLSLSRAIGDLPYKQYGVISIPELSEWNPLSKNDTFIIVSSDGIFQKMTPQDTCHLLLQLKLNLGTGTGTEIKNLAEFILSEALERGTMDNVAAVVVPLIPLSFEVDEGIEIPDIGFPVLKGNEFPVLGSSMFEKDYFDLLTAKFHSSLVEAKNKGLGCFYLSESLDEYTDYIFQDPNYESHNDIIIHNSEPIYSNHNPVGLYKEHDFCWFFGLQEEEGKGHCTNFETFSKFIGLLDSLPNTDANTKSNDSSFGSDFRYKLKRKFDRGSYGEVWLAFHWNCSQDLNDLKSSQNYCNNSQNCFKESTSEDLFILKRIMVERGNAAYLSGLREKYFGELFQNASNSLISIFSVDEEWTGDLHFSTNFSIKEEDGGLKHIARFVESFISKSNEIWLVYKNEGISLSKMVYSAEETKVATGTREERERYVQVVRPSEWWYWLRTSQEGQKQMQDIIRQLLMAIKACHDRNITHRDVKPENMIICFEDMETGMCSREIPTQEKQKQLHMRLIDFGSAIDDFTMNHLYGTGPTRSEQTFEYTPPEALLNPNWFQVPNNSRLKYDMWSVGVLMLELIIGSPHVFLISDRTRALLDQQLEGWSESTRELAYKLRSYMELCILIPGSGSNTFESHGGVSPASWKCSEESFSDQVKMKDPLKLGFPNIWALRLVRQLLIWHPEGRLGVDDALNHPYFQIHS